MLKVNLRPANLAVGSRRIHYGWVMVVVASIMWLTTSSIRFAASVLVPYMQENFGWTKLATYTRHESFDEMKHAEVLTDRILFLEPGGAPRFKIDYGLAPLGPEGGRYFMHVKGLQADDRRGFDEAWQLAAGETAALLPGPDAGTMEIRLGCRVFCDAEPLGVFLADIDAAQILESIIGGMSLGQDTNPFVLDALLPQEVH